MNVAAVTREKRKLCIVLRGREAYLLPRIQRQLELMELLQHLLSQDADSDDDLRAVSLH